MLLHHNPASSCSQKVRMALHEKALAYDSEIIDLQRGEQFAPAYLQLNPNGVVPTLEDQGNVLIESTLINEYLDDAYPDHALKPSDAAQRHTMRALCKRIDDALHPACGVLTYAIGVRPSLLQRPKADVDALIDQIPHPTRRAMRRSVVDDGVRSPHFKDAILTHRALFQTADELLSQHQWLAADHLSLADCALMPYVVRVDHLSLRDELTPYANLTRWYADIQARPAFSQAVVEWLPQLLIDGFKQAGDAVAADIAQVMADD